MHRESSWTVLASVLWLLCVLWFPRHASAAKILGIPMAHRESHLFQMLTLLEELRSRGHDVRILLADGDVHWVNETANPLPSFVFQSPNTKEETEKLAYLEQSMALMYYHLQIPMRNLRSILSDTSTANALKQFNPDLAIIDASDLMGGIIADYWHWPKIGIWPVDISLDTSMKSESIPAMMAFTNGIGTGRGEEDLSGVRGRAGSVLGMFRYAVDWAQVQIWLRVIMQPRIDVLRKEFGVGGSMLESFRDIKLLLLQTDYSLDPPRFLPPHAKVIKPLRWKSATPFPQNVEDILESSEAKKKGVVFVNVRTQWRQFGRLLDGMRRELNKLDSVVIWQMPYGMLRLFNEDEKKTLGPHVHVVDWVPLNDILSHPNVKLFVTHGERSSIEAAAYNGVPVVGLTWLEEQREAVKRAEMIGMGVEAESLADLRQSVRQVLNISSYRDSARNVRKRVRNVKTPAAVQAVNWVEYALEHDFDRYSLMQSLPCV